MSWSSLALLGLIAKSSVLMARGHEVIGVYKTHNVVSTPITFPQELLHHIKELVMEDASPTPTSKKYHAHQKRKNHHHHAKHLKKRQGSLPDFSNPSQTTDEQTTTKKTTTSKKTTTDPPAATTTDPPRTTTDPPATTTEASTNKPAATTTSITTTTIAPVVQTTISSTAGVTATQPLQTGSSSSGLAPNTSLPSSSTSTTSSTPAGAALSASSSSNSALSAGGIAGIAVGAIFLGLLLAALTVVCCRRRSRRRFDGGATTRYSRETLMDSSQDTTRHTDSTASSLPIDDAFQSEKNSPEHLVVDHNRTMRDIGVRDSNGGISPFEDYLARFSASSYGSSNHLLPLPQMTQNGTYYPRGLVSVSRASSVLGLGHSLSPSNRESATLPPNNDRMSYEHSLL